MLAMIAGMTTRISDTFEQQLMADLCRYIDAHCDAPMTLAQLSAQAQLSPAHLQRRFKAVIGVTPKAYQQSCRLKKLKAGLRTDASVSDALYGAGYGSPSRVYEALGSNLGMTPKQYRTHGTHVAISYAAAPTPLGMALMGATDRGLCFLQFGDDEAMLVGQLHAEFAHATITPMTDAHGDQFAAWMQALSDYLHQRTHTLELPLDIRGTAFQMLVWNYLQTIPPGHVISYKELAEAIGKPKAVRAVGTACGTNRIAIAIPCHRVIRGNGDLAGYRWGLARKRTLLDLERAKNA